ncbi:hypothetical protein TNCV_2030921 [Trichonephila clavipes]|nr:hypothetical protein TNCV_2030921 [Trichonephila clavipes]
MKKDSGWLRVSTCASWIPPYGPENKRQSMEKRYPGSLSINKFKHLMSTTKVMLTIFWDASGVLYTEFLTKGLTVTSNRGSAQHYNRSSNASTSSDRKEILIFCITTMQERIAEHKKTSREN